MHLPESGAYETVAGLLISRLGRMPENYDSVEVVATMDASSFLGVPEGQVGYRTTNRSRPNPDDDLPRAVTVRLTVHSRDRRRIETVVMSAVSLDSGDEEQNSNGESGGDRR